MSETEFSQTHQNGYLLNSIPMESKTWNQIGTKILIIRK